MNETSIDQSIEQHGGNLSWIEARYPHAPRPFIDLSTGINPYPYRLPAIEAGWQNRLADISAVHKAHAAAAEYYGAKHIALAAGMQPLMVALAALRLKEYGVSEIGVLSPTYGEHACVWKNFGHEITRVENPEKLAQSDVAILCNPNNPDGRMQSPESLLQLAEQLAAHDGWLIVDESFADLMPEMSIVSHIQKHENIMVLRSCGKFFGVAGLRVSSAIASEECIGWLRGMLGPWPISTAVCHLVPAMLDDKKWVEETRMQLVNEATAWRGVLAEHFQCAGHTALFTLVEADNAETWYQHLASQGVLVRRFDYNARWLRFGLPDSADLQRLNAGFANGPKL